MANEVRQSGHRQALRLRRALVAMTACLAFVGVAWSARENGLILLGPAGFWTILGPWLFGGSVFAGLIATGRNRGFDDPALTTPQILWAALGPLLVMPFAPGFAMVCQFSLIVIGLFGAFRLTRVRYALVNALLTLALGFGVLAQTALWPERSDLTAAAIGYAAFAVAMVVVTIVGFETAGFRRKLTERNDELTLAFDRLRDMAVRDELTGIHNRRFLMDALAQQKALADRSDSHCFTICYTDLDHFKRVNDIFGHAKGDLVLRQFANIAAAAVRDVDFVARLGGEEFVLVLVGTDAPGAGIVVERIRRELTSLTVSELLPDFRITASFGITEYAVDEAVDVTLARADAALYGAKTDGRDRTVVVDRPQGGSDAASIAPDTLRVEGGGL